MAILTEDGYLAASKQIIPMVKTVARTSIALAATQMIDIAGIPGAGVLPGTSTTAGVVPTSSTAGCPIINAFGGSNTGYLTRVEFSNTVLARLSLYDMLFKAGAYGFAGGTTSLAAQPSYLTRTPDGAGNGCEIWFEVSTAFLTGTAWQVQVTYTNQAGVAGRSTIISTALPAASLIVGRKILLALQAGDSGVRTIESVIVTNGGTAMTAGNFNILVQRPLWGNRVAVVNGGGIDDIFKTGMPIVYATSALLSDIQADSTTTGLYDLLIEIANG